MLQRTGIHKKGEITLEALIQLLHQNPRLGEAGAIASFTGIVRGYTHDGKRVRELEIEALKDKAEEDLARISEDLRSRPGVIDVLIHHMVGTFSVGEDIVYVVVAGKARKDIFSALMEAVERYKHEASIWKKEYLEDGTAYWVSGKGVKTNV